jgi:hypothetical protein
MSKILKTYGVTLPIAGKAYVEVQAANQDDAIDKAMGQCTTANLEEWESHRQIVRGNVFYGNCNEAEVELIDDED